ncbi:MAG TPA: LysO family transporter [Bacteroidales bacterium]|nr:LysO family transporter [Bacteroidales bacterium]
MLTVIIIMTSGILAGYLFRNHQWISKPVGIIITWAIYLLLFLLGITVGTNEIIISNLDAIGFNALLITIGAVTGSVAVSWFTYTLFFRKNEK